MGNDEFILYVRKRDGASGVSNEQLGKQIWNWIRDNANGTRLGDKDCRWGESDQHINRFDLPKTAMQFDFDRTKLPALYDFLDTL